MSTILQRPTAFADIEFESDDASSFRHDEQALLFNSRADGMACTDAARCRVKRIASILMPFVSLPSDAAERLDGRDLFALLLTLSSMNQEAEMLLEVGLERLNSQRRGV